VVHQGFLSSNSALTGISCRSLVSRRANKEIRGTVMHKPASGRWQDCTIGAITPGQHSTIIDWEDCAKAGIDTYKTSTQAVHVGCEFKR